ncbi:MAG: hypothetical protein V4658_05095, partial [Bacteroidota bacterium]
MSLTIEVKYYDSPKVITYDLNWAPGMNIQNAMEGCYNQYTVPHSQSTFTFLLQYSGTYNAVYIGYMVVAINDRQRSGRYIWNVYLNGAVINNGLVDELEPGDLI